MKKKRRKIILIGIGILFFISNFIYIDWRKYEYSGETIKCFNEYNGDFKTRNDDFKIKLEIINPHEGKIIFLYKGQTRFLVEAENIVEKLKEINLKINDSKKELLSLNNLLFDDDKLDNSDFEKFIINPSPNEFLNAIEINFNSSESLYDKFNKKNKNLDIELEFRFKGNLENSWEGKEKYWAV
ncbi:MAG: hypothetical protein ACRDDY_02400, partial [Clostridium sp.]|uniref:hypothetical protein n=1 Tax=Clostridium sp. TaxID=1506 RepID=UPI003EE44F19